VSPSARIVATAEAVSVIADQDGRRLTLRRLGALEKLRLFKAVGPVLAQNPPYLGMALLACAVAAIDEVPVPFPATEAHIEALVQRLGEPALAAIAQALRPPESGPAAERDHAKN
jgi:hypothetical protein